MVAMEMVLLNKLDKNVANAVKDEWLEMALHDALSKERYARKDELKENFIAALALEEKEIVSRAIMKKASQINEIYEIMGLFTHKDYRKRGLCKKLVVELCNASESFMGQGLIYARIKNKVLEGMFEGMGFSKIVDKAAALTEKAEVSVYVKVIGANVKKVGACIKKSQK